MNKVVVNKLTPALSSVLEEFRAEFRNRDRDGMHKFRYLGSGATATVYQLTNDLVVRVQTNQSYSKEAHLTWVKMSTSSRGRHFPRYFYAAEESGLARNATVVVSVMEKLDSLGWDADRSHYNNSGIEGYLYCASKGIRTDSPVRVIRQGNLAGAYSRDSIERVGRKAKAAELDMVDVHSSNVMFRTENGRKTLVITDPVI